MNRRTPRYSCRWLAGLAMLPLLTACSHRQDEATQAPVERHTVTEVHHYSSAPDVQYTSQGRPVDGSIAPPISDAERNYDHVEIVHRETGNVDTIPDSLGQEALSTGQQVTVVTYVHTYPEPIETYPSVYWANNWYYNVQGNFVFWDPYWGTWAYYWGPPRPLILAWNYHYPWVAYSWGVGYYGPGWYWGGVTGVGYHAYGRLPSHWDHNHRRPKRAADVGGPRPGGRPPHAREPGRPARTVATANPGRQHAGPGRPAHAGPGRSPSNGRPNPSIAQGPGRPVHPTAEGPGRPVRPKAHGPGRPVSSDGRAIPNNGRPVRSSGRVPTPRESRSAARYSTHGPRSTNIPSPRSQAPSGPRSSRPTYVQPSRPARAASPSRSSRSDARPPSAAPSRSVYVPPSRSRASGQRSSAPSRVYHPRPSRSSASPSRGRSSSPPRSGGRSVSPRPSHSAPSRSGGGRRPR